MPALVERPTMSRAMWEALKAHIMRERQRKKQEQEADAAIERLRRERENKQKQNVMTLEETKDQIIQLESRLAQHKDEKHELFLQLKKVLNDETRRKARETNDIPIGHYNSSTMALGGHPNMFLQTDQISTKANMYKSSVSSQPTLIAAGSLKRPHSPSPPPNAYAQGYNFKTREISSYNQKPTQYLASANHLYSHTGNLANYSNSPTAQQPIYNYSSHGPYLAGNAAPPSNQPAPSVSAPSTDSAKHVTAHSYHVAHIQQPGYVGPLHHQSRENNQKAGFQDDKYFAMQQHTAVSLRAVPHIHHSLIPIHQQSKQQGSMQGSITSGYPVRTQAPPPPPITSAYQVVNASQHGAFTGQQSTSRHMYTNQPPPSGRLY